MKNHLLFLLLLPVFAFLGGKSKAVAQKDAGRVRFASSDPILNEAFYWAKRQALAYAHHGGDPVGLWYEAALPGREAFCMRDVAHQSTGAAVLGLQAHTKNMLRRFAENITESKDYCSYWEINRYNKPAPVDYENDRDFWYNLPANFDLVDACYRQYLWTGDRDYLRDSTFARFYRWSVREYVDRWDLSLEKILTRNRRINLPEPQDPARSRFFDNRGIPGYNEGGRGTMRLGIDLTAAQYAAYRAYSELARLSNRSREAEQYAGKASALQAFADSLWWDPARHEYRTILYEDGTYEYATVGEDQAFSHYLLHFRAVDEPEKINRILDTYLPPTKQLIIELACHLPDIFFQYGLPEDGIAMLKYLCAPSTGRRQYPENPFAVVGAFATGLMGILPDAAAGAVRTLSGLTDPDAWAELQEIPMLGSSITVRHEGSQKTVFTNHGQTPLQWKACFPKKTKSLTVNNKTVIPFHDTDRLGNALSYVTVSVPAGATATVER